ncbi:hypothetical protein ABMA28_007792 [Loxostege sticticalis]|uniref:RNA-directed DNA polymerase n=1 Tax=Loxostege sticticalis TaxID=481309 RepID=A0ABD0SIS4_LOXSC
MERERDSHEGRLINDMNDLGAPGTGRGPDLNITPDRDGRGASLGVPSREGRGSGLGVPDRDGLLESPGVPRVSGRGDDSDNSPVLKLRDHSYGNRFTGPDKERRHRDRNQVSESARHKRRYRSSSSDDNEDSRYVHSSKRMRISRSRSRQNDTDILDKFLSILNQVKSSDKPRLTFNTNVIPEFDPMSKEQTILTWLTKVEECAEIYGWEDKEIIHYALPKLTGVAKSWYQGLPSLLYSWSEWKKKLIESFPCREDYAELLTEMLSKKVRYGESLEHYYYSKINLLNRCKIYGRQAVDCILYGVEDRAVKVGAQAAQFTEPEQVLKYFRTVKVGHVRDRDQSSSRFRNDRRHVSIARPGTSRDGVSNNNIKCFNCNEIGHRSLKCDKPAVKCTYCDKLGHQLEHCYKYKSNKASEREQGQAKDKNEKQVSRLSVDDANDKYIIDIKVDNTVVKCHVDLGSQCSLIKVSKAKELGLNVVVSENLPVLKGIGGNLVVPVGVTTGSVNVQNIIETIDMYVVEDYVVNQPILLGHSFTEKPNIIITKTPTELIFQQIKDSKIPLRLVKQVTIPSKLTIPVLVKSDSQETGYILVHGSLRGPEGSEYYLHPGQYEIKDGRSTLLIYNTSDSPITLNENSLLTRATHKNNANSFGSLETFSLQLNETNLDDIKCGESLTEEERLELQKLLSQYGDRFSQSLKDLGYTNVTEMVIELEDTQPIVYRPYRLSQSERALVRNMVQEMIDSGIARESCSPYASPIVLVQKKTGEKRLCVDYRALNRKTKKDHYPLPRVEDQLDGLSGNTLFTSLDLASGYYQIPISEESRHKTAFVTPDGQFEYNRMPFGLVNAPSVFQRTINKILQEAKIKYAIVYMDDILIPSKNFSEGLQRLEEVLKLLQTGGLTLKLSKCNFFQSKLDFLGFEVSAEGIRPGSRKTEAVSKFPAPRNQHELRQFLGLSGFFRRFIKNYSSITSSLTDLLKKDVSWAWNSSHEQAFNEIKKMLTQRPLLSLYNPEADTQLHTDASKDGLAGILMQSNDSGIFQPVSYFSRKTTPDERKLHSYELETLAVIASLNRFRVYLIGVPFKIVTDCNALRYTLTKRDIIPRVARWWVQLQEYDCSIEYRPGSRMTHVDALSRNSVEQTQPECHVLDSFAVEEIGQDWLSTVQSADEEVKRIKEVLSNPDSEQVKDYCTNFKLKNDRVYRLVGDQLKWLVPKGVRWQIVKRNHDDVGHCGFDKTLERIKKHYWFAKMRRFVKKYVASCLECAHHKAPGGKREGELHPIEKVSIPFHTIHADHLGPFIKSKKGNCYLLVIIDGFTKYINISPVKNTKSLTTIKVLKEHISYFGVPSRLITDKGSSFTSKIFKDFITSYGIKHIENAVATPRANGQVERYNRTILDALSTSSHGSNSKEWDENIADIQVGLNTMSNKTTQKSPSELLFGFNITSRSQGILSDVINDTTRVANPEEIADIREKASHKIKEQQTKDAQRFNKTRKVGTQYSEGDLVRVERQVPHDGQSQKLVNKYQGPYRIVKVLPNDRFLIEDTPLTRKKGKRYENVVALDKIQPWMSFDRDIEIDDDDNVNENSDSS